MHAVVIAVLVFQFLKSSECTRYEVSCTCPMNSALEQKCKETALSKINCNQCANTCLNEWSCCRYSVACRLNTTDETRNCASRQPECNIQPPPIVCEFVDTDPVNCLVFQVLESTECTRYEVSCTCPMNSALEQKCKETALSKLNCNQCANTCLNERSCCRYSVACRLNKTDEPIQCTSQQTGCHIQAPPIVCEFVDTAPVNCLVTCQPVITVPTSTPTTAEHPTLAPTPAVSSATAPDTSTQPTTTSYQSAHTDSNGNAQENQDAEDDAFPVATAVTVPVSIVAVAAIIVAVILRCRCKNTSKGDPDTNNSVMHKGVMGNALVNQSYNKHDISVNLTHASRPADDIAPDDTEYAECGPIDESLKPIGQRVREELGNKPGKKPLNGDPYDHLRQDGRSITRDANYEHLEIEVPDKAYSHINCVGERNDGNMDNGRISDIHTYTHLETNPGAVLVCESSIPIANDQKGKYTGNAYLTLQPESQQTVLRGDCEKVTTDHSPHEYVQLEKGGHCVAETTAEYTDMLGVGNGTSSTYQTLEATIDPVNDRIKLNGSPVIADAEDRTSVSHDYWYLISSAEEINGNLADTGIAEVHTVANTQALGNGMRTECNQAISPDMTKDIRNRQFPGNVYITLEPEPDQTALKGDYEQATTDYMPHDYVQLDK